MANDEHVKILLELGVDEWNAWRIEHQNTQPDLSGANLREAKLSTANFSRLNLSVADFYKADLYAASLVDADLRYANLRNADLRNTYLINADLRQANLWDADLGNADLSNANLHGADLRFASLRRANLSHANLSNAYLSAADLRESNLTDADLGNAFLGNVDLWNTIFADVDLSTTEGLDHCFHHGPSIVDHRTLAKSRDLPVGFLRGCGVDEEIIDFFRTKSGAPIRYYCCFISYSHADKALAKRLHDELQGRGIRCWLDEHEIKPGDRILDVVNQAIRTHDKLLLCCSETSLNSWWVKDEIRKAQERERKEKRCIIIPLNLDSYLLESWDDGLASDINSRLAADFTGWQDDYAKFEEQFEKLVKALTMEDQER